ncbi:uncharacterized protein LOC135146622 isoform X2 [Zophobas morio]|uniref:uncharacterized protein LOC135146622 isoform X2 n=1 Tax=Zophobas morio TaxID=2755281 RepID=UPI0030834A28
MLEDDLSLTLKKETNYVKVNSGIKTVKELPPSPRRLAYCCDGPSDELVGAEETSNRRTYPSRTQAIKFLKSITLTSEVSNKGSYTFNSINNSANASYIRLFSNYLPEESSPTKLSVTDHSIIQVVTENSKAIPTSRSEKNICTFEFRCKGNEKRLIEHNDSPLKARQKKEFPSPLFKAHLKKGSASATSFFVDSKESSTPFKGSNTKLEAPLSVTVIDVSQLAAALEERVILVSKRFAPFAAFSVIGYKKESQSRESFSGSSRKNFEELSTKGLKKSFSSHKFKQLKKTAISYKYLFETTIESFYKGFVLDNPEFQLGKHKNVAFLSSYVSSVIQYVKPADLKKDLNEQFREKFPDVVISLSKLRSLKRELFYIIVVECKLEVSSVALAELYFEKLTKKGFVHKGNRKLVVATCGLLAVKFNDHKTATGSIKQLCDSLERNLHVSKKEIFSFEFEVFSRLEFSLKAPLDKVMERYNKLVENL